jgi:ABC-type antimicrobial peptide transport system permease subunit
VWLFGVIGALALLLACINFMNLTTARAEKRAKEVGVRKAVGSRQGQLVNQFFSESMLITCIAFMGALLLTRSILPLFNQIADKKIVIPWSSALFWLPALGICVITGFLAGSYPAFYLSSFRPVKVLKGTFRAGRFAAIPRKVLVVVQFTVSVTLIAATMLVYSQIRYAKNRPVGYNREGLLFVKMTNAAVRSHYQAIEEGLLNTGAVTNVTASESPTTDVWDNRSGFSWEGKDPAIQADFATIAVRYGYGATVGLQFVAGRDFSKAFGADSITSVVVNEAAAKFMGMKAPIGQKMTWGAENITIIGVVKDMVMTSPYNQVKPTIYYINNNSNFIILRLNPRMSATASLAKIAPVFTAFNPDEPFDYHFVDQEYGRKFSAEERIGKLAGCFAVLTVFISCIGLFGLASFVAQQRTREIGIRKVMGASVFALWKMLSGEFIMPVAVAGIIAVPVTWHFLDRWLAQYQYHREVSPWFFITAGLGALLITLLTVSYHAISAATMSPVKSLRTE